MISNYFYIPAYFVSIRDDAASYGFYFWFQGGLYHYSFPLVSCFNSFALHRIVPMSSLLNIPVASFLPPIDDGSDNLVDYGTDIIL